MIKLDSIEQGNRDFSEFLSEFSQLILEIILQDTNTLSGIPGRIDDPQTATIRFPAAIPYKSGISLMK